MPEIFSSDGFMPHGHCYLWQPGLVWLHLISDSLIALAYTTIPFTLIYFVRKRNDVPFRWIFLWFGAFIVSCGGTHLFEAWNLYHSDYWPAGLAKAFTAVASLATAFLLVRVLPEAIALPSPKERYALSRRLVRLQEEERRAISRELHDEVGQLLTGLRLMMEHSPAGAVDLRPEMQRVVNEVIGRVRDISMNLRPPMLDDLGVLPTLLWQIERFEKQTHIAVELRHANLDRRFPPDVELTVVRVVQEALTNVAKHSGVARVRVEVWANDQTLGARIEDAGRGFDVQAALGGPSSGLSGIWERCRLLEGSLRIESSPGAGALLLVELPFGSPTRRGAV